MTTYRVASAATGGKYRHSKAATSFGKIGGK